MKGIAITIYKRQILTDVLAQTNQIGKMYEDDPTTSKLAGEIKSPDSDEMKPIVARSITEAVSIVKSLCQRYLRQGRDADDNRLERIVNAGTTTGTDNWQTDASTGKDAQGGVTLSLTMPDAFNYGVVETLKSYIHRLCVDHVMQDILINAIPDKAKVYIDKEEADKQNIISLLSSRLDFTLRKPSWS